jgi:hypothetical protein
MLGTAYKEQIPKERAKLYFEFLREYPIVKISRAVQDHIRTSNWFPKIAELIDLMTEKPPTFDPSYWPEFKPMDYNQKILTHDESEQALRQITEHIEAQEQIEAQARQKRFDQNKKKLQEQKKIIGEIN